MGTPPPIVVANLGMADSLILMVMALVVFGPRRLPQIGRQIGKLMYEFRKASNDFKFQMEEELRTSEEADRRKREEAERQQRLALSASTTVEAGREAEVSSSVASEPAASDSSDSGGSSLPRESTYGDYAAQANSSEASYPQILPPSTGETVASARPGNAIVENPEPQPVPAEAIDEAPAERETAADESGAVTEHATHNG
jgi:sec-independent protein translocase protein TatB